MYPNSGSPYPNPPFQQPYPPAGGQPYPPAGGQPYPSADGQQPYPGNPEFQQQHYQPQMPYQQQPPQGFYDPSGQPVYPQFQQQPPQGFYDQQQQQYAPGYQNYQQGYQMPPQMQPPMQPPMQPYPQQQNYEQPQEEAEYSEDESDDDSEEEDYESDGEWDGFRGNPTLTPADPFDPVADAAVCRKAMKGFGTDEDALIEVLCHRTSEQRQEIAGAFEKAYGKTLREKIKSETSGKFEKLLCSLLDPLPEFYCKELKEPLKAKKVLVEVLCSLYNEEIEDIKSWYSEMYGQDLEAAILGNGDSNFFQTLMISLTRAEKDEDSDIDVDSAKEDASNLHQDPDPFTYEGLFEEILSNRNYDQTRTIFREYQMLKGKSLLKVIKKSFSGDEKTGMVHVFRCLNNKAEFFAHQLYQSMDGLGTNDEKLIRLIVTRCEIDMVEVKAAFNRLFGKSLKDFIKGDCAGDYKHALYALIDEKRS